MVFESHSFYTCNKKFTSHEIIRVLYIKKYHGTKDYVSVWTSLIIKWIIVKHVYYTTSPTSEIKLAEMKINSGEVGISKSLFPFSLITQKQLKSVTMIKLKFNSNNLT